MYSSTLQKMNTVEHKLLVVQWLNY